MSKKRIWLIFTGVFIFLTNVAPAQVTGMTVAVDGMACPFCAFGVEKRLKKVKGVKTVAVDMKTGTAELVAKSGESIRYQDVPEGVKEAGFTAGGMKATVSGTVATGSSSSFLLQYDGQSFLLESDNTTMTEQLRNHAGSGKTVRLRGLLHTKEGENWSLTPESIEEVVP